MQNINVLHISNDFPNSILYKQLILHLDQLDIKQTIYSAVRTQKEVEFNPPGLSHLDLYIHNILYPYDRVLFRLKIQKIYSDLVNHIDLTKIDLIHAHSFFSDGAVALKIKEHFKIPYIVTFRHTAFNAFIKLRPDLKWRRNKILQESEKVIFISPAYRDKFYNVLDIKNRREVELKSLIMPNGLSSNFLNSDPDNVDIKKDKSKLRLLFVGRFIKLKNIPRTIKAVEKLNSKQDVSLTLVGGGGSDQKRISKMIRSRSYIEYLGIIRDRDKLREIYRSHDIFIMVSKPETFGLVYIEALSQGLPVIHAAGEGIDGYFKGAKIALPVENIYSSEEIARKIEQLSTYLNLELKKKCVLEAQRFNWEIIANCYKNLYESLKVT